MVQCSEIKVIKKDGTREDFNVQKVVAAVGKSAERAMTGKFSLSAVLWKRRRKAWIPARFPLPRCTTL